MIRVLLVEDDANLGYILKEYLQMHDFEIEWAKNGDEGYALFSASKYDICILDVMMPKTDGFTLAGQIRKLDPRIPLIFLTAKSLKIDKLKGFRAGCDDYIVKPVDEEELIARLHAVLRRSNVDVVQKEQFIIGSYTFQVEKQRLLHDNVEKHLTLKETRVLKMLCEAEGELVKSDAILRTIWGESTYFTRRSMDVFISKLRKYLSDDEDVRIQNIHGSGYILEVNSSKELYN